MPDQKPLAPDQSQLTTKLKTKAYRPGVPCAVAASKPNRDSDSSAQILSGPMLSEPCPTADRLSAGKVKTKVKYIKIKSENISRTKQFRNLAAVVQVEIKALS